MRRNIYVGATFLALMIALGVGITVLQKRAAVEAATVQAPRFEVDPLWPKPLPNHWILGLTIGVSVDAQDHVWIIHRAGLARSRANCTPPRTRRSRSAALPAPPVLEFDQAGNLHRPLGRAGRRLRLAGFESRHHRRLQGQRLDRRQRPRTASGRGARPLAGETDESARRRQLVPRQHGPEVHAGRKIPDADRQARPAARAATTSRICGCRPRPSSIRRPTSSTSPMATATIA